MKHEEIVEQAFSILPLQIACLFQDQGQQDYEAAMAGIITNEHFPVLYDTPEDTLVVHLSSNEIIQLMEDGFLQRASLGLLLHAAIEEGMSRLVRYLLQHFHKSTFNQLALNKHLRKVAAHCTPEDVDLCIRMGAELDGNHTHILEEVDKRPLSKACRYNNVSVVKHLVETYYVGTERLDEFELKQALSFAVSYTYHNKALAQWFIQRCNVSQFGLNNLLINSVNNSELVKYLLENFTFCQGFIDLAFEYACKRNNLHSMKLLFEHGPKLYPNLLEDTVASSYRVKDIKCIAFLVQRCNFWPGPSVIETALIKGKTRTAEFLLDNGGTVWNNTLFRVVEETSHSSAVDFLMERMSYDQEMKNKALERAKERSVCRTLRQHSAVL